MGKGAQRSSHGASTPQDQGSRLSFTGTYKHSIDAKGRLIVPSRLREELEDGRVVLMRWLDAGCISMWSGGGWAGLERELLEQRRGDQETRMGVRALAASAHQDEIDSQGRITVPTSLREELGIDRDVVIVGVLDHAEIWAPEAWEEEQERVRAAGLGELGKRINF